MIKLTFATKGGKRERRKQFRIHASQRSPELETYYNADQSLELICSTEDREDFERFQDLRLTPSDVIPDAEFCALLEYLRAQGDLQLTKIENVPDNKTRLVGVLESILTWPDEELPTLVRQKVRHCIKTLTT